MTTEQAIAGTGTVGITSVLQSAQSPDATLRGQAEQHLQQLRENNHVQFVASLTEELCEESKPVDTRRLAGLILKNELDARDEARKVSPPTKKKKKKEKRKKKKKQGSFSFSPFLSRLLLVSCSFCQSRRLTLVLVLSLCQPDLTSRTPWCKNGLSCQQSGSRPTSKEGSSSLLDLR